VAECDPAGGDLAACHGLPLEPGITSMAASNRHGFDPTTLATHIQHLASGTAVLVGPTSAEQAAVALSALAGQVGPVLQDVPLTAVLADCGRVDRHGPAWPLVARADIVVLVTRPNLAGVEHARSRLRVLDQLHARVVLLLVGEGPYPAAEVAASLGCEVVGVLADDPAAADALLSGRSGRRLSRSLLLRSARTVAEVLCGLLDLAGTTANEPPRAIPTSDPRVAHL
jgi:MinD-like ATPase involved in chromosome partitioning or flagellar assembly